MNWAFWIAFALGGVTCWFAFGQRLYGWKRMRNRDDQRALERQAALSQEWGGEPIELRSVTIEVGGVDRDFGDKATIGQRHPAIEVRLETGDLLYVDAGTGVDLRQVANGYGFFTYLSPVPGSVQPKSAARHPSRRPVRAQERVRL